MFFVRILYVCMLLHTLLAHISKTELRNWGTVRFVLVAPLLLDR